MAKVILNREKDITPYCGSLTITDNMESISVELSFSVATEPQDKYITAGRPEIKVGDKVDIIGDKRTLFSGIIITADISGSYTAFDYGYYLSNNDVILQLNNVSADTAIKKMCEKIGVSVGKCPAIPTAINKIYTDQSAADVLKDILEQATAEQGKNYFFRVKESCLNIYEYPQSLTYAKHIFEAGNQLDITYALGSVSGEDSISDMRNAVVILSEEDNSVKVLATKEDSKSISKYGRLQKNVKLSGDEQSPQTLAENSLKEYNTITSTRSVGNILGSEDVEAGVLLLFSSDKYKVTGAYMVKSVTHNIAQQYTMSLEIMKTEAL